MSLSWEIEPEKAEQIAKRRDVFEAKKWPLFASAGLLIPTSAKKIVEGRHAQQIEWDRKQSRFARKARLFRFMVLKRATPEETAILDKRRSAMPDDPAYGCAFWRSRLTERLEGQDWVHYQLIHPNPCRSAPKPSNRLKTVLK